MKAKQTIEETKKTAHAFRLQLNDLRSKCEGLQEVPKREAMPRIERLETMISALERDVAEVPQEAGADLQTTEELAGTISAELGNLIPEMDALLQGNPTTVSAVFDASIEAVNNAGEAIRKITEKISSVK